MEIVRDKDGKIVMAIIEPPLHDKQLQNWVDLHENEAEEIKQAVERIKAENRIGE